MLNRGDYIISNWFDGEAKVGEEITKGLCAHIYAVVKDGISDTPLFITNPEDKKKEEKRGIEEMETYVESQS